jgi:hypothetical protein
MRPEIAPRFAGILRGWTQRSVHPVLVRTGPVAVTFWP